MSLKDFIKYLIVLIKEKTSIQTIEQLKEYNVMTKSEIIEYIIYFSILANVLGLIATIINPFGIIIILLALFPLLISFAINLFILKQVFLQKEWAIHLIGICTIIALISNIGSVFSLYGLAKIPYLLCYGVVAALYAYFVSNKSLN